MVFEKRLRNGSITVRKFKAPGLTLSLRIGYPSLAAQYGVPPVKPDPAVHAKSPAIGLAGAAHARSVVN